MCILIYISIYLSHDLSSMLFFVCYMLHSHPRLSLLSFGFSLSLSSTSIAKPSSINLLCGDPAGAHLIVVGAGCIPNRSVITPFQRGKASFPRRPHFGEGSNVTCTAPNIEQSHHTASACTSACSGSISMTTYDAYQRRRRWFQALSDYCK